VQTDHKQQFEADAIDHLETIHARYGLITILRDNNLVSQSVRLFGEWGENEIKFIRRLVSPGETILDIGSNIGTHALAFANLVGPEGGVIAVEPSREIFEILHRNVEQNRFRQVRVQHGAAGEKEGETEVPAFDVAGQRDLSGFKLRSLRNPVRPASGEGMKHYYKVMIFTIDSLGLSECDLIKINVEGAGPDVVTGASQTIKNNKPFIYAKFNTIEVGIALKSKFDAFGYKTFLHLCDTYNPDNYFERTDNIFGNAREAALLGVSPDRTDVILDLIEDPDILVLRVEDADAIAFGLLQKPQFFEEALAVSSSARTYRLKTREAGEPAASLTQKDAAVAALASLRNESVGWSEERKRLYIEKVHLVKEQNRLDSENIRLKGEITRLDSDKRRLTEERNRLESENKRFRDDMDRLDSRNTLVINERHALEDGYLTTIKGLNDLNTSYASALDNIRQVFFSASKRHLALRHGKAILSAARRLQAGGSGIRSLKRLLRPNARRGYLELSAIFGSDLFDPDYYLTTYPDVKAASIDPAIHYFNVGDAEGRDPGPAFSTRRYKDMNPDVTAQRITALGHYEMFGRRENRSLPFPESLFPVPPTGSPERAPLPEVEPSKPSLLVKPPLLVDGRNEWLTYQPMVQRIADARFQRASKAQPAPALMVSEATESLELIASELDFSREDCPLVSIVVPVFNNLKLTLECLQSLQKYTDARTPFEVIVTDDASTDASKFILPRIRNIIYRRNDENLGFIMNCNSAASLARGEFILFLNNDVQVTDNWLVGLVGVFATSPQIGAAGSRILYPSGHLQEAGGRVKADCTTQLIGLNDDPSLERYNFARRVDYCSGACLIVKREMFTEVGGFSEFLRPAYCEDLDLSLKLRQRGFETWYTPNATVLHHLSKTSDEIGSYYKMRHIVKNTQKISERWQNDIDNLNRIRIFAFYLPQYHPILENNRWWGHGFTEWTNVTRGTPQYEGHWQPRLPADLGFYDLRRHAVLEEQADLAHRYGITGFCYYYYWFAGKRLLELPLETMLASGKPDLPFLLCWGNENWTRRWDGKETEILISQSHSNEDDSAVILDLIRYFRDPRYVRINGRPVLLIYRIGLFPDFAGTAALWREMCRAEGIGEIYLAMVASFDEAGKGRNPQSVGCDAVVQFPPHGGGATAPPPADLRPDFRGNIWDYEESVLNFLGQSPPAAPYFPGVMPSWDNTARRMSTASVFAGATPGAFQAWLEEAIRLTCEHNVGDERIVFVNAWNEWAEGTHLEPDRMFGHANLEAVRNALVTHTLNASRH
jgi:FkbM family methyltransferase